VERSTCDKRNKSQAIAMPRLSPLFGSFSGNTKANLYVTPFGSASPAPLHPTMSGMRCVVTSFS